MIFVKGTRTEANSPKAKKQCAVGKSSTTKHGEVNSFKHIPICHYCGIKGHIRPHCKKFRMAHTYRTHVESPHTLDKLVPTCHFCGVNGHIRPRCFKLYRYTIAPPQYYTNNNGSKIHRPRHKMTPQPMDRNIVIAKHMPKIVRKVKTKLIWVRKLNLVACEDLPTNPLDDIGSSGIDRTF